MNVSIVIPAYNEEKRIGKTLEYYSQYFETLRKRKELEYEIIVAINNTIDGTLEIVKKWHEKNRQIRYINLIKGGKGYAVIEGFKIALKNEGRKNSELIGFVDADLSTKPDEFYSLIKKINGYDGVIASRYIEGARISPRPTLGRIIASRFFNIFVRVVLFMPYRDTQCGAKIFKREAIAKTIPHLTFSKWAFDIDLIYSLRKKGFKIEEVPTTWGDKYYSKINFTKAGPWMALAIIRLRLINSRFKFIVRGYDKVMRFMAK